MSLVNLLPQDYLSRRAQNRANLLCAALFGVVMVGVLCAAGISEKGYRNTREVCERVNRSYDDANKLIKQLQDLESTRQLMLDKASRTSSLLEKVPRSNILAAVANALPENSSLLKFEMKPSRGTAVVAKAKTKYEQEKSKTAAGAAAAGNTVEQPPRQMVLTLTGLAGTDADVARFITSMKSCPLIDSPDLVYSQEKKFKDVVVREFQVTMVVRTNVLNEKKKDTGALATAVKTGPTDGEQP